ncbi:MAG TPA: RHS repeat-associated core domain-containing protein [Rhizomicrobium sp.]|nr:RHS repeat-associated core domain-containing protein [Rhizomicrobium sp.]
MADRRLVKPKERKSLAGRAFSCLKILFPLFLVLASSTAASAIVFCGVTLPPEIVTQAAALKNDPDLIYEFVYNNIQTIPQHGSLKGPLGTLLDGSGTETDQAELMASLLQAAGYTNAQYQTGLISINAAQLTGWLGTDTTPFSAAQVLANGGFDATSFTSGGVLQYVTVPWVWVKVQIGGTYYVFDPAGKRINGYNRVSGVANLGTVLGYSQSSFLSNAVSGATVTDRTIAGLNRTGIRTNLQGYAQNLINYIRSNNPSASTSAIIGGTAINPLAVGTHQRISASTGFGYLAGAATDATCIPTGARPIGLRTTISLSIPGASPVTFNTSDIYGRRLSLFFDSGLHPVLRLDGVVQATGSAATSGSQVTITTSITHNAYKTSSKDVTNNTSLKVTADATNGTYVISNGWGPVGRGMVERHRRLLQQNTAQNPGNPNAEAVLGESLAMLGYTWLAERGANLALMDQIAGTWSIYHHAVGIVGIKPISGSTAPYVDLPINRFNNSQRNSQPNGILTPLASSVFFANAIFSSALESGVIEQTQPGAVAMSTAKLIDIASQSNTIFDINNLNIAPPATPDNCSYYVSNFRGTMDDTYLPLDLGGIDQAVGFSGSCQSITDPWRVIAPSRGDYTENSWGPGVGYYLVSQAGDAIGSLISGGLSGGYPATPVPNSTLVSNMPKAKPGVVSTTTANAAVNGNTRNGVLGWVKDPVNRVTGTFAYDHQDLSIGSAGYPLGLGFQRLYDSASYLQSGPLGFGWTHNFATSISLGSDGFEGLGANSPLSGAGAIAAFYVMQDILNVGSVNNKPADRVVIADLAAVWLMEKLTNNTAVLTGPEGSFTFVLLPDGVTYNPPFGSADALSLSSGIYTLTRKDGSVLTFNSQTATAAPGALATWHSPAGPTVTYNYDGTSGNLLSVSTGTGAAGTNRTLSFSYNGSNQITSVSDGTGRSASYSYDASGNLSSFTDPLGSTTRYAYDPANSGRMTQYFKPSVGQAFITNSYDAMGRITAQTDAAGNVTQMYFAGPRTEVDDAVGNSHVFYFSPRGKALIDIDGLGNKTVNTYDGLDRLSTTILPEGNGVAFTYDTKNNPLTVTQTPKSGASIIVRTYTYDPLWNKVKTASELGVLSVFSYDPATGNLLSGVADAGAGRFNVTSQFSYNARGQVTTATDPLGVVTQNAYDSFGNLTSSTRDYGTGRLNLITKFAYSNQGDVVSLTDPKGSITVSLYDAARRLTRVTDPLGLVTAFTYDADANLLQTQQSVGATVLRTTSSTYTPTGQVATSTDANGKTTRYTYDADIRLERVTDPVGHVTRFTYDANSRRQKVYNDAIQAGPLVQLAYTANGLSASVTDAKSHTVSFTYDTLDRLSATTYPDGAPDKETLTYDANSNISQRVTRKGNITGSGGIISFGYDTLNRLCTKTIGASIVACGTTGGGTTNYRYDRVGRLIAANDGGAAVALPSGSGASYVTTTSYDALNRPLHTSWTPAATQTAPASASTSTFTHGYDANSRRIGQAANDNSWLNYPASASSTAYTANTLDQYSAVGGTPVTYDGNGNLASDGTFSYCYDTESRLTSILSAGTCASPTTTIATYAYDAQGRRKSRTVGGTTTLFVTDADNREVLEYNGSGVTQRWYAYGQGSNDVLNQMNVAAGTRATLIPDIQGSVIGSLASGGTLTKTGYRAFGENPSLTSGTFNYTAQRFDAEAAGSSQPSGLYYYRARMYSPTWGRFLQPDPSSGSGTNLYAYVDNDPLNNTDPQGLAAEGIYQNRGAIASTALDFVPIVGDAKGIYEAYQDPSLINIGAAAIGLIPGMGDIAGKGLKTLGRASDAARGESLIYRSASGTPASMTPRAVDTEGLSAADSFKNALSGKNQVIDTSKLKNLCATCDNPATGHVTIAPKDMSQMPGWINSRGGTKIHPLTQELMDAVVDTVKK